MKYIIQSKTKGWLDVLRMKYEYSENMVANTLRCYRSLGTDGMIPFDRSNYIIRSLHFTKYLAIII